MLFRTDFQIGMQISELNELKNGKGNGAKRRVMLNGTFRPKFPGRFKRVENVAAALGARLASHPQQKKILIFPETNIDRERERER